MKQIGIMSQCDNSKMRKEILSIITDKNLDQEKEKAKINVLFLDYDGVVNTPMWNEDGTHCSFATRVVNNFQACQWVSEFCKKYDFKIVVTSTWRVSDDYKEALYKGGLRQSIEVIDRTPVLRRQRGEEIQDWLDKHPEVEKFIIVDDDSDMCHLMNHLLKTDCYVGFTMRSFEEAEALYKKLYERQN